MFSVLLSYAIYYKCCHFGHCVRVSLVSSFVEAFGRLRLEIMGSLFFNPFPVLNTLKGLLSGRYQVLTI